MLRSQTVGIDFVGNAVAQLSIVNRQMDLAATKAQVFGTQVTRIGPHVQTAGGVWVSAGAQIGNSIKTASTQAAGLARETQGIGVAAEIAGAKAAGLAAVGTVAGAAATQAQNLAQETHKIGPACEKAGAQATGGIKGIIQSLRQGGSEAKNLVKILDSVKWVAGGLFAGMSYGLGTSIKAAGDANETLQKFGVVFGEYTEESLRWANSFANAVGRARIDVIDWAATLQNTFVPIGYSRKEAAALSKQMVQLGVDLGSFSNVAPDDVIRDLTSAIVGNHETVRKYGVIITENALKQEALRLGIGKGRKELSELEKVQARLSIITRSTTDAQGDAIRTAGSYANQTQRLHGNLKNLRVTMGQYFQGAATIGLRAINTLLGGFNMLPKPIQAGVAYTGLLATGLLGVVTAAAFLIPKYIDLADSIRGSSFAMNLATKAQTMWTAATARFGWVSKLSFGQLLLAGAAIGLVVLAVQDFVTYLRGGESMTGTFLDRLKPVGQWFRDHTGVIKGAATVLGVVFGPALIHTGYLLGRQLVLSLVRATVSAAQFAWSVAVSGARALVQFGRQLVVGTAQAAVFGAKMIWAGVTALASFAAHGWKVALGVVPQIAATLATATVKAAAFGARMLWAGVTAIASFAAQAGAAVATAIPGLIAGLGSCATAAWGFTAALLANPITWVVAAVVAGVALVGYGIYQLVKHWDVVKGAFAKGGAFVAEVLGGIGGTVKRYGALMLNPLGWGIKAVGLFTARWDDVEVAAGRVWTNIKGFGSNLLSSARRWGPAVKNGVGDALTDTRTRVSGVWDRFKQFGADLKAGAIDWGQQLLDGLWSGVQNLPQMLWDALKEIPGLGKALEIAEVGVKAAVDVGGKAVEAGKSVAGAAVDAGKAVVGYVGGLFNGASTQPTGLAPVQPPSLPVPQPKMPVPSAQKSGFSLAQTFAQGIQAGTGLVTSAMFSVTNTISSFLPHSPAKQGPLSTLDETGPKLVDTLVQGIVGRKGAVATAMSALLTFAAPVLPAVAAPELPSIQPLQIGTQVAQVQPPELPNVQPVQIDIQVAKPEMPGLPVLQPLQVGMQATPVQVPELPTVPALQVGTQVSPIHSPELPMIQPLQIGASVAQPVLPQLQPVTFPVELEQSRQATVEAVAGVFGESEDIQPTRTIGGGRHGMAPVMLQVPVTIQNVNVPPGAAGSPQEIGRAVAEMVQREVRRALQQLLTETWISAVEEDPEE